jgi:hypothetical protein
MTIEQVKADIQKIYDDIGKRDIKYRRNFNRYANNGFRREDIHNLHGQPLGYYNTSENEDGGILPVLNIGKSCINTLISKLSQVKVRPFFNPVNGSFQTRKVCRSAQVFFDDFFDSQEVYKKGVKALKDACIFDYGVLYCDDEDQKVKKISPWQFFFDQSEWNYGELTRCYISEKQYPLSFLKDKINNG